MPNAARMLLDRSTPSVLSVPTFRALASLGWMALVVLGAGCSASDDDLGTSADEVGGGWRLPSSVAAAGAEVSIRYESAGGWNGGRSCSGKFREGARALGREIMTRFGQVKSIGGYSCRRNTANASNMSVHGTGKALDIFIPMRSGRANSELGDPVANWLVTHAAEIGVQYIIWNRTNWRANGSNNSRYGGPVPHTDHIHAEITEKAAKRQMPFFNQMQQDGLVDDQPLAAADPNATGNGNANANTNNGDIAVFGQGAASEPDPHAAPDVEDAEPGEEDSLGTGIRSVNENGLGGESKPIVGGCSAAPARTSESSSPVGSLALMLAAALVMRRRRAA